jgi:light-independent protochlorophyllide reductase subunit B
MKLAYWMYAGPAHIGTLRIASSFKNVHAIMHAPLGDDYFNVMRSMLERERDFTPVTASIVDRHVLARGSQEKVIQNITRKEKEEKPDLIILTPTCTSSILQEDLHNFVEMAKTTIQVSSANSGGLSACRDEAIPQVQRSFEKNETNVLLADVNHYRVNELQAADRTLEQIVRFYTEKAKKEKNLATQKTEKPTANIIGIFTLGFHHQHDCRELKRLLHDCGIEINEIIPEGCYVENIKNLSKAWFNIVPYRELGLMTAVYLEKELQMPYIATTPMGLVETSNFLEQIDQIIKKSASELSSSGPWTQNTNMPRSFKVGGADIEAYYNFNMQEYIKKQTLFVSGAAWFSRSIDCQNLTGKKAVVFGDATHAASMTQILAREMGIRVACAGTYCKHDSDWFREQVQGFCDQILITDDHTQVGDIIAELQPSAIFGTQMERHVGKRLDIPCGVISPPIHIQNFPLGYRPFLGYEGANQIADLVYNSFNLGMEDHLLSIFGGHDTKEVITKGLSTTTDLQWSADGLNELNKIPGFVRGKVKRNTEKFARQNSINTITVDVLFAAKEAVGA